MTEEERLQKRVKLLESVIRCSGLAMSVGALTFAAGCVLITIALYWIIPAVIVDPLVQMATRTENPDGTVTLECKDMKVGKPCEMRW